MEEKVIQILADYASMDPQDIGPDSSLQRDLSLNSLDVINLVVDFEERFGIVIDEPDIRRFQTVQDLLGYLAEFPGLAAQVTA